MTPALALGAQAATGILGGMQAKADAEAQKQQAEINSYIGRTRAMQTDVSARDGLNLEMAEMRAAIATAGEKANTGTLAIFNGMRKARGRDRRIEYGNDMAVSADYRNQANSINPNMALLGGVMKAAPSIYDMYQLGAA